MAFKWDVNLGHMLIAVPLVIGLTVYVVTDHNEIANLTVTVDRLRSDMTAQIAGLRTDIANLPDVRAQVSQHERRITALEVQSQETDKRLARIEGMQPPTMYRSPR